MPFISICIPTYNSGEKLVRLLKSIEQQTFTNFEIVISDDSNNHDIHNLINTTFKHLNIFYYHNATPLGTPNNWNNAVSKSKGDWINLMHHDDWYTHENSLLQFAEVAKKNATTTLLFCAFENIYLDKATSKKYFCSWLEIKLLKQNYLNLYKTFLPNPSCTLINKNYKPYFYDKTFKWLIDFDFYTTLLGSRNSFTYIPIILVNVGMHSGQVTAAVFQNASVEIPESIALIDKYGEPILKNIFVYDFYWRLYRNLNIRNLDDFNFYLKGNAAYTSIKNIIDAQSKVSANLLQNGFLSKGYMVFNYLKNYFFNK